MTMDAHRQLQSGLFTWTTHKHYSTVPNLGHQVSRFLWSANTTIPVLAKFLILHSSSFQFKSLPLWSSLDSASWINPATQCHVQSHAWPYPYALSLTQSLPSHLLALLLPRLIRWCITTKSMQLTSLKPMTATRPATRSGRWCYTYCFQNEKLNISPDSLHHSDFLITW